MGSTSTVYGRRDPQLYTTPGTPNTTHLPFTALQTWSDLSTLLTRAASCLNEMVQYLVKLDAAAEVIRTRLQTNNTGPCAHLHPELEQFLQYAVQPFFLLLQEDALRRNICVLGKIYAGALGRVLSPEGEAVDETPLYLVPDREEEAVIDNAWDIIDDTLRNTSDKGKSFRHLFTANEEHTLYET